MSAPVAQVLGPELVDDRGARRRLVAEHAAAGSLSRSGAMISAGKPFGKVGNALVDLTSPAISQCPVVVSLPAEASRILPNAPARRRHRRHAEDRRQVAEPERPAGAAA